MNVCLTLFERQLELYRYPKKYQHPSLQAWDAADELIIQHITENLTDPELENLQIYNDDCGALTCWFSRFSPLWFNDSYVSYLACRENLTNNDLSIPDSHFISSTQATTNKAQVVIIKIPKTTALLEQQLIDLQSRVTPETKIIAGGKAKLIQKSTLALFEKYLGPTHTSLAKKKSRLIFCQPAGSMSHTSPYPTVWETQNPSFTLHNLANVFSRQQLDIGARFMLQHIKKLADFNHKHVVDLGCGNGVLALHLLHYFPEVKLTLIDESYMAVESAKQNIQFNQAQKIQQCQFVVNNCLENEALDSPLDYVVCNPPFHQQNTITDHIAWQMFQESHALLKKGGALFVIGNRHLDYPAKLKRLFGGVTMVASDKKFSILSAVKK